MDNVDMNKPQLITAFDDKQKFYLVDMNDVNEFVIVSDMLNLECEIKSYLTDRFCVGLYMVKGELRSGGLNEAGKRGVVCDCLAVYE